MDAENAWSYVVRYGNFTFHKGNTEESAHRDDMATIPLRPALVCVEHSLTSYFAAPL